MSQLFRLASDFKPAGDQAQAIEKLVTNLREKQRYQTLLGVTGSGKTFTMANVIAQHQRPTLIMTHNKTLATQLYHEFKEFFPDNAVEYFVSYYDYYQPEAYVPRTDLFIEKDTSVNDELDKLRLSATRSLFEREDVIIISSVSCIYGLGSPEAYSGMLLYLMEGQEKGRDEIIAKLVEIQYERNLYDFHRGTFRVRGDTIEVFPAYDDDAVRIELFGDEVESIQRIDPLTGKVKEKLSKIALYPASHYVQPKDAMPETIRLIDEERQIRLKEFVDQGKLVEFQRLDERTRYDMEMLEETGRCPGVENYSRIMSRRPPGAPPPTLIDYFPKNSLLIIDESHVSIPQIGGMYKGDRARKQTLVDFGFRLPSALDNRPLRYEEFDGMIEQVIYVSATPGELEKTNSQGHIVEQIIRPTGLLDPVIEIRPTKSQVDEMYGEIQATVKAGERVLITTLTKRMAEDLTDYYKEMGVKVKYLHSDIDTVERAEIVRNLRLGEFDVLVGINLLREGLDLPEVSLVAIFDADKEGFLRSHRSLLQTCGRAARNLNGRVIMFADKITDSMQKTLTETRRRREIQDAYNQANGITPQSIKKKIQAHLVTPGAVEDNVPKGAIKSGRVDMKEVRKLEREMRKAAEALEFERAAELRDQIMKLKQMDLELR
ncbi:MAG: excinuclease ABC subunit UvrB [bacterium]|nr:excinuclease ABC subunit UvrB [bacterium]